MNSQHRVPAFAAIIAIILLSAAWTWANRLPELNPADAGRIAAPHPNFAAPSFALADLSGQTVELSALQGKVVILNFWASWCPPCRAEMPELDRVFRETQDAGARVLAVDQMEDVNTVRAFGDQLQLSFPLLLDSDGAVSSRYQVRALPTTFFIDRRGVIRDVVVGGPMTRQVIEDKLKPLLAEAQN